MVPASGYEPPKKNGELPLFLVEAPRWCVTGTGIPDSAVGTRNPYRLSEVRNRRIPLPCCLPDRTTL